MPEDKARVLARGTALVPYPHPDPRSDDTRKKIGREYKELQPGFWGFSEPAVEAESVSRCVEIAQHLADGDLLPGDADTATWANTLRRGPTITFTSAPTPSGAGSDKASRSAAKESA